MTEASRPPAPAPRERTRDAHPPAGPDPVGRPLAGPVYRTAAWVFDSAADFADLMAGRRPGYSYSRVGNPTADAFAAAVAALEAYDRDGQPLQRPVAGEPFASGMAAICAVLLTLGRAGSHVVAPREVYGGTYGLLRLLADRFALDVSFVDTRDPAAVAGALRPSTVAVYAETIANPTTAVADLPALAAVAHAAGLPLVVDSTFAGPAVCRPLEHGADLVVHSATKYLGGHGDATGGVAVGGPGLVDALRATRVLTGSALAPDEAALLARGLATLSLRCAAANDSALALARALAGHPGVWRVEHPGLASHPDHALAGRLFVTGRYGAVVTVTVPGGRAGAAAFCDRLRLVEIASSLGSHRTKVSPVATTTHRQLDDAALAAAGIDPGAVRISVGLEDPADLLADLLPALDGR